MKTIDMASQPRRAQYEYFRTLANPYLSVTANCDITLLRQTVLENGWPFFLTALYCAVNAANAVPELRRRIKGETVVEYETCISSHTVALPDSSYCYCELDCAKPFAEYLPGAQTEVEKAKARLLLEVIHKRRKKSSTIFCSQWAEKDWYDQICGGESTLADAIMDRISYDSYKINIEYIDKNNDRSMREVYGMSPDEAE